MSLAEVRGALEYVVPGFVALKIFYVLALRTRRSDFEWTLLSVAVAALLNFPIEHRFGVSDPSYRAVDATIIGAVTAVALSTIWRAWGDQRWGHYFRRQAWDQAFSRGRWVAVWLKDGPIVLGWTKTVAESADTDDPDLYLVETSLVDRATNEETSLPTVRGMWIASSEIQLIQVLRDAADPQALAAGSGPPVPSV